MTSERQTAANQRNAHKSCGPRTGKGKLRSRRNALRHGLAAETVVGVLENLDDYQRFENAISADYQSRSALERELIGRLASLLWRLRRATAVETGLLQIQARILQERKNPSGIQAEIPSILFRIVPDRNRSANAALRSSSEQFENGIVDQFAAASPEGPQSTDIARCFLRISNIHDELLERVSHYESGLWRQVKEILVVIDMIGPPRSTWQL